MKLLFVHQNFPGQFPHLARGVAADPANSVVALHINETAPIPGVRAVRYPLVRGGAADVHPWAADFETKVIRGESMWRAARALRDEGFVPDAIVAHPGWGETLFAKEVWPRAKLGLYAEYFYRPDGSDVGFDPEFADDSPALRCRVRAKNANLLMAMNDADAALSPTAWQRDQHPDWFRSRITVCHDGIDTAALAPLPGARFQVRTGDRTLTFTRDDEVITCANRHLEPYRGIHVLLRALPELLARRPQAHVLIAGTDGKGYGAAPPAGSTWRQELLRELDGRLDLSRVHFVGRLARHDFTRLLQVSRVHVYLSYPFVLSWSLLEAMSCGAAVVASDVEPVREVVTHAETGLLVPFREPGALADTVASLSADPGRRAALAARARARIVERYDLASRCLPAQRRWIEDLVRR